MLRSGGSNAVSQILAIDHDSGTAPLPVGVSIVLYRTRIQEVAGLVQQLLDQRVSLIYLIDNSPPGFGTFLNWRPRGRTMTIATGMNLGYGRGHNLAIRDSVLRHRYHLVCNPDIELGSQTIPALYALLEERTDVGLCIPKVVGPDGELHYLCKRKPSPVDLAIRRFAPASWFQRQRAHYEMREFSYENEMEPAFVSGCFMFFRATVLERLGGFDERFFLYMEDLDLSRRAQLLARNLYHPKESIVHGHQQGAHKSLRLLGHFGASMLRYFNKWGWLEQRWFR